MIEELIGLAREMRASAARGVELKLTDDELAFYDALEVNDSAVKVLGDENLRTIARELVATVRDNITIEAGAGHCDGAGAGRTSFSGMGAGVTILGSNKWVSNQE